MSASQSAAEGRGPGGGGPGGRGPSIWLPWREGPASASASTSASASASGADGSVVVSLTNFSAHRQRHWPGVYLAGLRLREGWYAMPGALGLWLWMQPLAGRGGSVSVWSDEADLRRFVALPAHLAIMRRYRPRGVIESHTWRMERFSPAQARSEAERRIGLC